MPKQLAGWVCVLMAGVALAGDKPKEKAFTVSKPVGTWTREAKGGADVVCRLQLTITDDRLTLTAESKNADRPETVRLDADYSINKESVLFGVIDTFDGASPRASEDDFALLTRLSGQPFSVRFRVEDGVLTLKEFKGMGVGLGEDRKDVQGAVAIVCGRYTMAETSHLTPERIHGGILKADPPKEGGSRLDRVPYPTPHYLKHYPTYVPSDPPFPGDRDRDAMLDPTGELKQAKAEEPVADATRVLPPLAIGECGECDPPTDAAVLKALGEKAKGFDGTITVVKKNLVDQLDPARFFPVVGQARLHHCHWECRVYLVKDLKAAKPVVEVVYIDTDCLRLASAGQIVVPKQMPEK